MGTPAPRTPSAPALPEFDPGRRRTALALAAVTLAVVAATLYVEWDDPADAWDEVVLGAFALFFVLRLAPGSPARLAAPDDVRAVGRQLLVYAVVALAVQLVASPLELRDASALPDEVPTLILWLAQLVNRLV